eukprot:12872389-Alexandrium_andersonii.AAC.1
MSAHTKRATPTNAEKPYTQTHQLTTSLMHSTGSQNAYAASAARRQRSRTREGAVSYTHLTLPTICSV